MPRFLAAVALLSLLAAPAPHAAAQNANEHDANETEQHWLGSLEWRGIGPSRGGRVSSVAGVAQDPHTYYMGATGGGVWKTTDAGHSWSCVSDGFFNTGSIGSVAVAPSDPNVVYAGTGEPDPRGNFSHGDGVYRSTDAGNTWTHLGLTDTRHIGRIVVHPDDPDTVYVAALGHVWGPNEQRGLYRSTDGGHTWQQLLHVNQDSGAIDLAIDPNNPRNLFCSFWQVRRQPWRFDSGGPGSALFRSTDGGDTWHTLNAGLPQGVLGKIGVSVSQAQRDLVYAIVEAEDGGVFRSEDGGDTWTRTNEDRALRQRAWYYSRIHADPQDPDTVYVLNVRLHRSTDGGTSFQTIPAPHVDHHGLWIDPNNNQRLINGNDGGANVSFDAGKTWSRQDNQTTAQFYRVTTDTSFPYRVLGAQQDNSTASISHTNRANRIGDLHAVGGGESGYIAPRPDNPDIVFAGSYAGYMTRYDHRLRTTRNIQVWPENPIGGGADELTHRFQWTFPIVVSPHDPNVLYTGGERVFVSTDEGETWTAISDDLTTNDKSKQASSGGPITQDNTTVEYYCTVFTIAESPLIKDLIWVGTDDGLIHVSEDARTWRDVTPPGMGDWPLVSLIEASPHDPDKAYAAVTRYKLNDFTPFIYRTTDRGRTWASITEGIDDHAFVRTIREDPVREGLLYCGTETGVYVSFNDGDSWQPLQLELPRTPITDLTVKDDDLVVATQGRAFWILPGLSVLRQHDANRDPAQLHLFTPADAYREGWDRVAVHFNLPQDWAGEQDADTPADAPVATLAFEDNTGTTLRTYTLTPKEPELEPLPVEDPSRAEPAKAAEVQPEGEAEAAPDATADDSDTIEAEPGMNRFAWSMRAEPPVKVPGAVGWPGLPGGAMATPGTYRVVLTIGEQRLEQTFAILPDPRLDTTDDDWRAQGELLGEVYAALNRAHEAVNTIRGVRAQIDASLAQAGKADIDRLAETGNAIKDRLTEVEETIIQTKSKSPQDPLNFPVRLNDKLTALTYAIEGDFRPTAATREVFASLDARLSVALTELNAILDSDVPEFNALVEGARIPAVVIERD